MRLWLGGSGNMDIGPAEAHADCRLTPCQYDVSERNEVHYESSYHGQDHSHPAQKRDRPVKQAGGEGETVN